MDFSKWFADRFRELRKREGMTQSEFAEHSGIGIATIERIERGKANNRMDTYLLIAQTLGISLSKLFDDF